VYSERIKELGFDHLDALAELRPAYHANYSFLGPTNFDPCNSCGSKFVTLFRSGTRLLSSLYKSFHLMTSSSSTYIYLHLLRPSTSISRASTMPAQSMTSRLARSLVDARCQDISLPSASCTRRPYFQCALRKGITTSRCRIELLR
jgi:hypothetical protein